MKTESENSVFSDFDLHLFGQGSHDKIYELLGAHPKTVRGKSGVNFAVWAPNAVAVHVAGDFNSWDTTAMPLAPVGQSGIWERFVPGACSGQNYRFFVTDAAATVHEKSDPFGVYAEVPPKSASVIHDLNRYTWNDAAWLERRARVNPLQQAVSIYEVHLGSWQKRTGNLNGWLNYRELARQLVEYCKKMGFTHLELMPVAEHPLTRSWGYQTVGYYSVTSRYGTPEDFMYFVDHCHQNDIGVIVDWVPAHFPRDRHGLARFDGTAVYEHEDPRQGEHPDWGTLIFNYGRNEVRNFLVSNALFWFDKYHVDGIRVDAVASMLYLDYSREEGQWIPNRYGGRENLDAVTMLKQMNEKVHLQYPGTLTIAEESTAWPGVSRPTHANGLGFSMKWNMGWMNDTLRYMRHDPVHRKYHHNELTFSLVYAFSENFVLPFSHDEVVHGKRSLLDQMPGDHWQKFANLRLLYSYMWTHPGKKLLFMSGEFAQWDEWNHDESIQWDLLKYDNHRGVQNLVSALNQVLKGEAALHQFDFEGRGFEWISCDDALSSTISYMRRGSQPDDVLVVVCNFTPVAVEAFQLGVPLPGEWTELLNSDSTDFGGSGIVNSEPLKAVHQECNGQPFRLSLKLPPLAAVILKPQSGDADSMD